MSQVTPSTIFAQVSEAVPENCRQHIVIIGSLAAGYHFFKDDLNKAVRTKDIDCVLEPFSIAVEAGQAIAQELLAAGWQRRLMGEHQTPGTESTPTDQLPAIRLYPPGVEPNSEEAWFIEFLTVPKDDKSTGKEWTRLSLDEGDFGLPTFRFLGVTAYQPLTAKGLGIRYARPELMALANLLSPPEIGPEVMSSHIQGRGIKRANKDLGRVLAIATLADLDDYRPWVKTWQNALQHAFPDTWQSHAQNLGAGLRALLDSEEDLEEAHHTCVYGLLTAQAPSQNVLKVAGLRLLEDAIKPIEEAAQG